MALKKKITKAEFEKLSDDGKKNYIADGDDYKLDLEGDEDVGALKRAKDREVQKRQEAENKLKELQDQLEALEGDDARKKGDIKTLEKAWQKKIDDLTVAHTAKITTLTQHLTQTLVDNVASKVASEISNAPTLILPHIKARLKADFDGDTPVTRVLDKDGKVSTTLTVEDLKKEIVANKEFSAIIVASKASGGAGSGQKPGNGGAGGSGIKLDDSVSLATMNPRDLALAIQAKKEAEQT